jgi:hypothetical protein
LTFVLEVAHVVDEDPLVFDLFFTGAISSASSKRELDFLKDKGTTVLLENCEVTGAEKALPSRHIMKQGGCSTQQQ